jgi:beta-lactamase regulating signal transducer with metallopeptidase domain
MIDWLLGTFVATSVLIILVLLIREPVRRHFGARVAYGLWLIPAARLLMPTLTRTVERQVPHTTPIQPFVPSVLAEPKLLQSVEGADPSLIEQFGGWPLLLGAVWLGVALALLLKGTADFRRQRAAILASSVQLARIGSIRIVRSPEVRGPLAFGIFDRVIAVPADFDKSYSDCERRLALDHELSHHRSGDLVANLAAFIVLCLQWFNPLAWVAHAAFRFDQEAACDARVLDKANAGDRIEYGRAIAKAASGRALLFASALDRRHTLKRRLSSMFSNPTQGRRLAGRLMLLVTVAVALPLTATRAIEYVDVKVPAPSPVPAAPAVPAVPAIAAAQTAPMALPAPPAPAAPTHPVKSISIHEGMVTIDGKTKRFSELTPAEKAEVRRSVAEARRGLAESHVNRGEIDREVREAMQEVKIDREEIARDLAEAREEIARAMAGIDVRSAELRRSGVNPEQLKATIRTAMKSVEAIDVDRITKEALASVDRGQIEASIAAAEESVRAAEAELDQIEEPDRED